MISKCSFSRSCGLPPQEHVTRICRIIQRPSGNAMLIGVGGSGKQSLSRLAAFICGFEVRQLSVTSKFKVSDILSRVERRVSSPRVHFQEDRNQLDVRRDVGRCHLEGITIYLRSKRSLTREHRRKVISGLKHQLCLRTPQKLVFKGTHSCVN